jgi:hypothetical protein
VQCTYGRVRHRRRYAGDDDARRSRKFHPTGRVVVAGIETSTKTLNRFYFGRISDVKATRKGQDKTSDLAKTDLVKLKEWLDSTLTKTFTIGTIP